MPCSIIGNMFTLHTCMDFCTLSHDMHDLSKKVKARGEV